MPATISPPPLDALYELELLLYSTSPPLEVLYEAELWLYSADDPPPQEPASTTFLQPPAIIAPPLEVLYEAELWLLPPP